jgi:hypothetical protein
MEPPIKAKVQQQDADLFLIKWAGHKVHRPYKYPYHDGTVHIGANRGYIRLGRHVMDGAEQDDGLHAAITRPRELHSPVSPGH